ncbi:hypothetical protein [Croceibacter atlanticus]|uniref:hypothetical protein n=1 Tax=Croceibacter atlanticus TaxID=313588 RepID=UPI0030F8AFD0
MPKLKPYTFAIRYSQHTSQKLQKSMTLPTLNDKLNRKSQRTTMYKNNSGLIAKTKVSKYKIGLFLTEKLMRKNPLLFLY